MGEYCRSTRVTRGVRGPKDGTFAEYVNVPAENVVRKPSYLTWEESGVLALSALTAYRALLQRVD